MGQRHQIFVKIVNPTNAFRLETKAEKEQAKKEFGTGKFSILAYHNQWLYGRSALINCANLLRFGKQFTHDAKTVGKEYGGYDSPVTVKGIESKFHTQELLTNAIGFIMNFKPVTTAFQEAGIGGSWYIGKVDGDVNGVGINFDFTCGDNNDGITIIDVVENKYCFMNIYKNQRGDELGFDACDLPYLKPVDARKYVSAYYGETINKTNPYYFGDYDRAKVTMPVDKQQAVVNKAISANNKVVKLFNGFEVLTLKEIQVMFPKMEQLKKNLVVSK